MLLKYRPEVLQDEHGCMVKGVQVAVCSKSECPFLRVIILDLNVYSIRCLPQPKVVTPEEFAEAKSVLNLLKCKDLRLPLDDTGWIEEENLKQLLQGKPGNLGVCLDCERTFTPDFFCSNFGERHQARMMQDMKADEEKPWTPIVWRIETPTYVTCKRCNSTIEWSYLLKLPPKWRQGEVKMKDECPVCGFRGIN